LSAFVPWISARDLLLELELVVAAAAVEAELEPALEVELELEPQPARVITDNNAISGGIFRRITPPSFDGRHRRVKEPPGDGVCV
jgi:hypothetical protein